MSHPVSPQPPAGPAEIAIDLESATPPYEQVRRQISVAASSGALPPGTRMPSVRALAADLGIAPGTVARAYKELEAAGVVVTAGRRGTVIAEDAPATEAAAVVAALRQASALARGAGWDRSRWEREAGRAWG